VAMNTPAHIDSTSVVIEEFCLNQNLAFVLETSNDSLLGLLKNRFPYYTLTNAKDTSSATNALANFRLHNDEEGNTIYYPDDANGQSKIMADSLAKHLNQSLYQLLQLTNPRMLHPNAYFFTMKDVDSNSPLNQICKDSLYLTIAITPLLEVNTPLHHSFQTHIIDQLGNFWTQSSTQLMLDSSLQIDFQKKLIIKRQPTFQERLNKIKRM